MREEHRYFSVVMKNIEAVARVDTINKRIKIINCSNFEPCFHLKQLTNGVCPGYCPAIVELKKYVFRGRNPKADIRELESAAIENEDPLQTRSFNY
ncbi:MAG: hypothetical protein R6U44_04765 [Archaeoglobaceae archaeon]